MTPLQAWVDGWRRSLAAPTLVIGLWGTTLLVALPPAIVVRGMLAEHLDSSVAAESAASGVNFDWWNEFLAQAGGLGQTFVPAIMGFAAVLKNLSSIADTRAIPAPLAAVVGASLVIAIFLLGGVLDRLARDRVIGAAAFFAACGVYFFRLLRLFAIAAAFYVALFVWLHPLLFDRLYATLTLDVTVERTAFLYRLALYVVFFVLVGAVNLIVDYAKIRMVVEDRRSAVGALAAAVRFVRRHTTAAVGLYLLNTLALAAVVAVYALVAPGARGGARVPVALLIGQLYIVARLVTRVAFAASQIALFQSRLAHAGYTAAPPRVWPDSPAAAALPPP